MDNGADDGRRLTRRSAVTLSAAFPVFLGVEMCLPQDAMVTGGFVFLCWVLVTAAAATGLFVGYTRTPRAAGPARTGPMSDTEANLRYRQAIEAQHLDAWRTHRDDLLAAETDRVRARDYLALPEGDRYQRWVMWQLADDPRAETLPYPPPAYPPPTPKALPAG